MSDTNGADRSDGNDSYLDWLEESWESFGDLETSEEEPEQQVPTFVWYPMFMGHFPWPMQTRQTIKSWVKSMKIAAGISLLIIGVTVGFIGLAWFHNLGQIGFGR